MREIVIDTETTGLREGDRIIEIGAVELFDKLPTGNNFQVYINPAMALSDESVRIHGITSEFLKNKPFFSEIVQDFLNYIGDSPLVAHNASFDARFLNSELKKNNSPALSNLFIDTLAIARKKFPNMGNSLDVLCKRFGVTSEKRGIHGALTDAILLAKVYYFLSITEMSLENYGEIKEEELEKFEKIIIEQSKDEKEKHMELMQMIRSS